MKPTADGDELLALLGMTAESGPVRAALAQLARCMQPKLGAGDANDFVDWVTVNEIGLEFGFEDAVYVNASDIGMRRTGPLLLTQIYFYGDTAKTMPFPYPLPFGLSFMDDRAAVLHKMAEHEASRRSFVRDAWRLPHFNVTTAYRSDNGLLESVLCHRPSKPWPVHADEWELVAPFTPDFFARLFGLRWSSAKLRSELGVFGFASALPEVRSEHCADLRMAHGIEFTFAPGCKVSTADAKSADALSLASVTYCGPRVYDAPEWVGLMPFGLVFEDSQADIAVKLGRKPDERRDFDRIGFAVWHLESYSLRAEYSNIENRLLRATIMAPGFWVASGASEASASHEGLRASADL